jgi:V8-like Glu-specific endopeptidase
MGLGPSKEKIRKILEHSITNPISSDQKNIKIEYKFDYAGAAAEAEENSNSVSRNGENKGGAEGQSFILSEQITQELDNSALNVKNMNKFPYSAIGTISCKFPVDDTKEFIYTCFLIDTNVVLTLA